MIHLEGAAPYLSNVESGIGKLTLVVWCELGGGEEPLRAFLDSGAQWAMLPGDIAASVGIDAQGEGLGRRTLHTRLGSFNGCLERHPITLTATEGENVTFDATWFVSDDWWGPIVLGWNGCLDRVRFAVDPEDERFLFGAIR